MSKLVAFAAIQGGYNVVSEVEGRLRNALATYNADTKVEFPNTGYYLPVIYSLLGHKVENLEDLQKPLTVCPGAASAPYQAGQSSALLRSPSGCRYGGDTRL